MRILYSLLRALGDLLALRAQRRADGRAPRPDAPGPNLNRENRDQLQRRRGEV